MLGASNHARHDIKLAGEIDASRCSLQSIRPRHALELPQSGRSRIPTPTHAIISSPSLTPPSPRPPPPPSCPHHSHCQLPPEAPHAAGLCLASRLAARPALPHFTLTPARPRIHRLHLPLACMAAYDIQKHFKALRVDTGRRRRNPFDTGFEDEIDDARRSRKPSAKSPPNTKPATAAKPASPNSNSNSNLADRDDEFLTAPPKNKFDRRLSPAPDQLAASHVSDGAARRPSAEKTAAAHRRSLAAKTQAGGILAYLDESDDEADDTLSPPARRDRRPSPSPRNNSDAKSPGRRSSSPRTEKENAQSKLAPPRHTVASPFAGTKYLQDSDDEDDEALSSRSNSQDDTNDPDIDALAPLFNTSRTPTYIKRVDKPKAQQGGGVSWRAFSEGRADQRSAELAALQANLRRRGKSISFGTHAVTDDGERIPLILSTDHPSGPNARKGGKRGRSPPRLARDVEPTADETADTLERYDPAHFKTNPFTGNLTQAFFLMSSTNMSHISDIHHRRPSTAEQQ